MYSVTISAIHEREDREFSPIGTIAEDCCKSDATEFAELAANELANTTTGILNRIYRCDGICISVVSKRRNRAVTSYVVFPCRAPEVYHDEECI